MIKPAKEHKAVPYSLLHYARCKHPSVVWLPIINNDEWFSFQVVYNTKNLANNFEQVQIQAQVSSYILMQLINISLAYFYLRSGRQVIFCLS